MFILTRKLELMLLKSLTVPMGMVLHLIHAQAALSLLTIDIRMHVTEGRVNHVLTSLTEWLIQP